jgi:nitrogen-specific signal transduction histidine kinase
MASGKPIFGDQGEFLGYRGACSDITEQIDAADALFQAQKMESVGQLTGGLAHDFNNLLAVMIGNMELADETITENPRNSRDLLRKALNAAERGALLIQRLLAFSRRQALSPKIVDVNILIAGLSEILEHSLGDTIQVRRELADDPWLVRVDPSQLESVILNLALNARDAMPSGGLLTIRTRNDRFATETVAGKDPLPAGDYVTIEVSDTGSGMTPEVLDRIFEPFFTTKDTGRGSGLGLSMAYGFVRQSGGAIKAESEAGKGSRIIFYLPSYRDTTGTASNARTPGAQHSGKGERIMLVEDDAAVRDLLVRRLRSMGYDVVPVDDAVKALKVLPEQPDVDLLLTDVVLPGGIYGDKLAVQARQLRPGLKVLFMSGYPKNAMDHLGQMGVDAPVLRKPFRNQELAVQLRRLLDPTEENA